MKTSLPAEAARGLAVRLQEANAAFVDRYPGESARRQPCHTVYVGAHEFHADLVRDHGRAALRALADHAPDAGTLASIVGLDGTGREATSLADTVYARVVEKLRREPVEDLRIDFEDGYGSRPDDEEDAHAVAVAETIASCARAGTLPPFIGIRTKPLNEDLRVRSVRTVDVFLTALTTATQARLPPGFVLTLAKVTIPEQVSAFADLLESLEPVLNLSSGALAFEIMIEVAQAVVGPSGECHVPLLVEAGRGRCIAAHFGTYDYTASCGITAAHQTMFHPACDYAKQAMQASLAGRGVFVSDGSTNVVPVGSREAVHAAWRMHAKDVRRSLVEGFYQGWDMHPAQIPTRFAAVFAFFLEALPKATDRMRSFLAKASRAGNAEAGVLDDAATGQALLNFFLRGMSAGAITEEEALATGVTLAEIRARSFAKILAARRA